ncbi:hypothetical protein, partial [Vibrio parahaemolyticus]|uniref:hypothetical protein n=1 Tax=Vibrio parahaemolyticus TaxID=670 RepID=UPI001A8FCD7D
KKAFKRTCYGKDSSSKSEEKKTPAQPKQQPQGSSIPMNQVLRNIQQMEQEDRVPIKAEPLVPKGERPW